MFFSKLGGTGSNFRSGSKISLEGCTSLNLTPPKVHEGMFNVRQVQLVTVTNEIEYFVEEDNFDKLLHTMYTFCAKLKRKLKKTNRAMFIYVEFYIILKTR